jgi:predicted N-formylglutamate amidohydrolase
VAPHDSSRLIVTCEHASNAIPNRYRELFASSRAQKTLRGHEGIDLGANHLARVLANRLGAPLIEGTVTRLLVDLNRSLHHPELFSRFSLSLSTADKRQLLARYYQPFRQRTLQAIERELTGGKRVVHVSVHSFTPKLGGSRRNADIGLLYDPGRAAERELCLAWQSHLGSTLPELRVRRNYPYRGVADGHATALRRQLADQPYVGIELEVNQALRSARGDFPVAVADALCASLDACLGSNTETRTDYPFRS